MAKRLLIVVSVFALAAIAAGFERKQLRCSDTNSYGSGLTNFKLMCMENIPGVLKPQETNQWLEKKKDSARMLDFIEQCTCTLLSMTMVWETMLTHEVEILYAVSRDFVEEFHKQVQKAKKNEEKRELEKKDAGSAKPPRLLTVQRSNPLFAGDDGDTLYHYYVVYYIVHNQQRPSDKVRLFDRIINRTAKIYFDLKHLESNYLDTESFPMDHEFTLTMSGACKRLTTAFEPYLLTLSMMRNGFDNEMWIYRVVSHDETLFKLVIASMLCKIINEQVDLRQAALMAAQG